MQMDAGVGKATWEEGLGLRVIVAVLGCNTHMIGGQHSGVDSIVKLPGLEHFHRFFRVNPITFGNGQDALLSSSSKNFVS